MAAPEERTIEELKENVNHDESLLISRATATVAFAFSFFLGYIHVTLNRAERVFALLVHPQDTEERVLLQEQTNQLLDEKAKVYEPLAKLTSEGFKLANHIEQAKRENRGFSIKFTLIVSIPFFN